MIFDVIMDGLGIANGIIGGGKQKKLADKQAKIEKAKVEKQFKHNKAEVTNAFFDNAEINFYNISDSMFTLTTDYIGKNAEASFNATVMSGGAVFSSVTNDIKNALKVNYMDMMTGLTSERAYNERTLYNNSVNTIAQLEIDREAELQSIHNAKAQAHASANQSMMNSVISGIGSIYSSVNKGLSTHEKDDTPERDFTKSFTSELKGHRGNRLSLKGGK